MRKCFLLTLFILLLKMPAFAQQDAQYSQYMFNSMVINPAYAGYRETLNVSLLHRDQWTGFTGAPRTQTFLADGAFTTNKNVGIGVSVVNDKSGLLGQSSAYLNYAYRLPVGIDSRLSFGLAAGVAQYRIDNGGAQIEDPDDQNFNGGNENYIGADGKFGVHFSNEKLYAGLSVTNLLARAVKYESLNGTVMKQGRHFFLTAGYLVDLNDDLKLKPSFLFKEDLKGPTSLDINSFLLIRESVWIGGSYRTGVNLWKKNILNSGSINQNSVVGAVEFLIADKFRIGYAYDQSLGGLKSAADGSHEISLGLVLNARKNSTTVLTPRYF
jgi:type IX secretion system PorP/SprF family membrane protein